MLCMVMRAVGGDEMLMMGWLWPRLDLFRILGKMSGMR